MSRTKAVQKRAQSDEAHAIQVANSSKLELAEKIILSAQDHAKDIRDAVERAIVIHARCIGEYDTNNEPQPEDVHELGEYLRLALLNLRWLDLQLKQPEGGSK